MTRITEVWVYLARTPLLWLTLTVVVYVGADLLHRRLRRHAAANPVLLSVLALLAVLHLSGTEYATYFEGAQFVHFLLGPATVALAVPLHRELHRGRPRAVPLTTALLAGSLTAVTTAIGTAGLLGASPGTLLSLAPKSATTPVAMGIAEQIGGLPSLTAALVILTGITGAVIGTGVLRLLRVKNPVAAGLALGTASHGIGTARAFQLDERAGAYSGLAMGLNALVTALIVPLIVRVLIR
ncbi:LrgB family protein [Anaeromyxobacter sp. Fw109-5]|uniref:LrgB family protein n=1 Tax=Anaeromyxobacter sp. (strain Fw109-5) TaxID=404589 RepID=UPI000158A83F|nr:LrgB family protein [Anaeromyxobacter sp. Fw109-5]ABS27914.1 LrgB family protein [Anaeromyxobacter sp. Fw109-5]